MIDIEVLKIALSKEKEAELLSLLITEEQKHKILIEKKIVELTRS